MSTQSEAAVPAFGAGTWAYDRGRLVPAADPVLPLATQCLHYGTGTFEGIRAYRSDDGLHLFRAREHYERMLRACRALRITVTETVDDLIGITVDLVRRNGHDTDTYVRPLAYKLSLLPGTAPGVSLAGVSDALSIVTYTFPTQRHGSGVRCSISSWRRPRRDALPVQAKIVGGYVTSALAADEARAAGLDDAILLDAAGNVAEASTSNVFAVLGGRIVTPPVTGDLLPGITRDTVITLCRESGLEVVERILSPAELLSADEVFLSSTGTGVVPVLAVSGRAIGSGTVGPVTNRAVESYEAVTHCAGSGHGDWLTRVDPG
ncbi:MULTISPECIES: branched-chain-amino-acid transaminase [unclassified Streptomyces]|uniref:branched-chain-amino-acid transaminase n=1 Tax=unclassified Streptomyces TaxID=2593676 RepID=UPI001F04AFCD|nr:MULTISPECIES: branched-chain-amino-acid transaminase [unclassified Streptomyces]MCH0564862.1 branched-chain-amino-acid transaminase [Streptomyces sp. MUM 2J]MCH0569864.1 branched-chain-amino-acid transaminase [Streptomyces sp. MUM 136J]